MGDPWYVPATAMGKAIWELLPSGYALPLRCSLCGSSRIRALCSLCDDSGEDHHCNDGCRECGGPPVAMIDLCERTAQHAAVDALRALGHERRDLLPPELGGECPGALVDERCNDCKGSRVDCSVPVTAATRPCPICAGTGKIRRAVPASTVSARILAQAVRDVEAGREPVRGVARIPAVGMSGRPRGLTEEDVLRWPDGSAILTCDGALSAGWALLDSTQPFGVRVRNG